MRMHDNSLLHKKRIWVAGHNGLVGSAVTRLLQSKGYEVLTIDKSALDCRNQSDVLKWMERNKPDVIVLAAAKVGGIAANMNEPASFIYDNLMIEANIIHSAYLFGVEKLLFLGSSCIYPKNALQPLTPDALFSGNLESTNAPYALAKLAGIEMCKSYRAQYGCKFISALPCNLYGINDKYDTDRSHVIPALIHKAHLAKTRGEPIFQIWGSGKPLREFLYVDDLAEALVMLLEKYNEPHPVNIGSGEEISIYDLAHMIADTAGLKAEIQCDTQKPDGVTRKLLDSSVMRKMGWSAQTGLKEGLKQAYQDYLKRYAA
jgi:GDP-L-fucose synthase